MTSFIEEEKVTSALEAGASGYVLKDAEAEEVAAAVRAAFAGEVHLDPAVARLLAERMRAKKSPDEQLAEPLTDREKDVLRLLGQGMSNRRSAPSCSSPNGPPARTCRTSWASSAWRHGPRRLSTRSSTSSSSGAGHDPADLCRTLLRRAFVSSLGRSRARTCGRSMPDARLVRHLTRIR
jgi:hypothetical protein